MDGRAKKNLIGKYNNTVIFVEVRNDSSVAKIYWTSNTGTEASQFSWTHHLRKSTFPIKKGLMVLNAIYK